MTLNEAYRLGQEHMRRKIERHRQGWFVDGIGRHCDPSLVTNPTRGTIKSFNAAKVPNSIRFHCRVEDLP